MNFLKIIYQELLVTEMREQQPATMNAFDLISMSKSLNLDNLFYSEQVCLFNTQVNPTEVAFSHLGFFNCFYFCSLPSVLKFVSSDVIVFNSTRSFYLYFSLNVRNSSAILDSHQSIRPMI